MEIKGLYVGGVSPQKWLNTKVIAFSKTAPIKSEHPVSLGSAGDVGTRVWISHLCPSGNQEQEIRLLLVYSYQVM